MKLGPHIIHGSADGLRLALEGAAPVAKFVDGFSGAGALAGRVPVIVARATIGGDDKWRHGDALRTELAAELTRDGSSIFQSD